MIPQAALPLLFALAPALHPDSEASAGRRLRKAVRRHEPVSLGSLTAPYEPAAGRDAGPLATLVKEEGLEVSLTTATPRILRELDLLVDLDRRHSITVRMMIPAGKDPEPLMRAVEALSSEGIATSILFSPDFSAADIEDRLRPLLERAWDAGAWDVEIDAATFKRAEKASMLETFRRLRLENGFPRALPGRG